MSPEELLEQLEKYESRRKLRDHRPDWLRDLIGRIADLFEPLTDVARAGYDCRLDDMGWLVRMYLGTSEIIGGPKDGQIEHASFRLDVQQLIELFESVEQLEWYSISNTDRDEFGGEVRSILTVVGKAGDGERVQLELLASPPRYAPPGLYMTTNGPQLS